MKWREVNRLHGTVAGVGVKNGVLRSLLLTIGPDALYPNKFEGEEIAYYVPANPRSTGVRALSKALDEGTRFTVFQKIRKDEWMDLGFFVVISKAEKDSFFEFILAKSTKTLME